jgi:5-methyltetrahydropteroyltriglutamate--homocysteine methyltransferase
MTKWFDTNYHYIVPELGPRQEFSLRWTQVIDHYAEARARGITARPVLLGPVTFLLLAKPADGEHDTLSRLGGLLPVYEEVLRRLSAAGADWVQVDEPALVTDLAPAARKAFVTAYDRLARASGPRIMLTSYFGDMRENLGLALSLPVAGLHADLVRGPGQAGALLKARPRDMVVSLGLVDGRNVWRSDLHAGIAAAGRFVEAFGPDSVVVASSCSLLHSPEDLSLETDLDPEIKEWLAFARQKTEEIALIARALTAGPDAVAGELQENSRRLEGRRSSPRVTGAEVQKRLAALAPRMARRSAAYPARRRLQAPGFGLPPYPTTTIGSFPQTAKVRARRADYRAGTITLEQYEQFLREEIERTIRLQESLGLDVLVHGEFERNDMVEYFGEMLSGFAFTRNGWVQSYGSRCVKPPIIYGDVARPRPMTVRWSSFAQSLTTRPVKGMLTGPVTILMWSFVRDDQPRDVTCRQIALALRDEVRDLEAAGIRMIQIDEPALREGLPLRAGERKRYLAWAVEAFRIASSGVRDETQIHTHMCYSEFNDIIASIADMDADVISIESARSKMELLDAFRRFRYPNEIGPGVYDIHSPRVPAAEEIEGLLERALGVLRPEQLWVNPDCGLKTREWAEVEPSLSAMVQAARALRDRRVASRSTSREPTSVRG